MTRRRIATVLVLCVLGCGGGSLALVSGSAQAQCSSAGFSYGGEGNQISQTGCEPTEPSSTLPFTGLDLGLLVAAGLILIAGGTVLRLRLRHGGHGEG